MKNTYDFEITKKQGSFLIIAINLFFWYISECLDNLRWESMPTGQIEIQYSLNQLIILNIYNMQIKNINNPTATGFFSAFVFECLYPGTNTVLQLFYNSQSGITIKPGQIKAPAISGNPLNMNLRIDYTIVFTPTNTIPNPGKIEIYFPELSATPSDPNVRSFTLDIECRVISGLDPLVGNETVNCVTSGSKITITLFQTFLSQQITVKVYATNPGRSATYSPFIIRSSLYSSSDSTWYVIDENTAAGSVLISEVTSLKFVKIDFFTLMTNGTFGQLIPLDFRLYPQPGHELPLSTTTNQHEISIQLPLLWRNKGAADFSMNWQQGYQPAVTFGSEPAYDVAAYKPKYYLHIYQFKTPHDTDYKKYPSNYGLAQCDLPISIASVILPPFGGKYLFRVLTFLNGAHYTTVPQEQDLYQMDIAIPEFKSATITSTGSESGDGENVVVAKLTTGMQIPYEGAINFNMTTVTIYAENTSKWDVKLGQPMLISEESVNVPCSIYISSNLCGFSNSNHPNARCYVFKGSEIDEVILQVRGFAYPIASSTQINIYIPNIRFCEDVLKQCFMTVSSAYTSDRIDPYILDTKTVKVVSSVNTASPVTRAGNTISLVAPIYGPNVDQREICLLATWNLGNAFYSTPFSSGDAIMIIFPSYRFTYSLGNVVSITYSFGAASGNVIYIDYYTNSETYYLIILNAAVPVGNTLYLHNIKNADNIYDFTSTGLGAGIDQGVEIRGFYWQTAIKTSFMEWARASKYTDGGIIYTSLGILPNGPTPLPNRNVATDMEWEAEVVYMLSFTNCRIIPNNGLLKVKFPAYTPNYKSFNPTCTVKSGLNVINQLTISTSVTCVWYNDGTNDYLLVSGFKEVAKETQIILIYRATNPVKQATVPWNPGMIFISSHDATVSNTQINFTHILVGALNVNGPSTFPTLAIWQSFYVDQLLARQGDRGYFKMKFTSPITFVQGSTMTVDFGGAVSQPFSYETIYDLDGWQMQGYLYCSIDGDIAEDCEINGQTVTLRLPKSNQVNVDGVKAGIEYSLIIGYRGNDDSSTTRDGFLIGIADSYILSASITGGSNTVSTQKSFRNLPPSFTNFWVHSLNKMNTDTSDTKCFGGGTKICGRTVVIFYFNFATAIPDSYIANTSQTQLVIEFQTYIDTYFANGFEKSLGTGLPQRSEVPCEGKFIVPLSGYDRITCKLYLGAKPNPAQIVITNFSQMNAGINYEIHIPNIFNPVAIKQLLSVTLRAETTITATASALKGKTFPQYENSYNLVNMTNTLQSHTFHGIPVYTDLNTCNPTFVITNIDTYTTLNLCFRSGQHVMQPGDKILFQFPQMWNMLRIDLCALGSFPYATTCDSYDSSKQVLVHVSSTIPATSTFSVQIKMNTPPYAAITPAAQTIEGYTFWRSRIHTWFKLKDFTQTLIPLTILAPQMVVTASSHDEGAVSEYTIKYDVIRDIPSGGCIQIIIPTEFKTLQKESICRNAILSGSDFDPYGYQFKCDFVFDTPNDYLLIHSFGPFKLDYTDPNPLYGFQKRNGTTLFVNFRVQNPMVASPSNWEIKQWYLKETPLNLLVAKGTTPSPNLSTPVAVTKWEKLLQTRNKLYTQSVGPLEFIVKLPYAIAPSTFITVQMPTAFTMQTDAQLFCFWDITPYYNNKYPGRTCSISATGIVTIESPIQKYLDLTLPTGTSIPIGTYVMIGISTLDHYYGNNGVVMPTVSGFYDFLMTFPGAPSYTATRRIYVPHKDRFQIFEPTTIVNNPNEKTVFDLYVKPYVSVSSMALLIPVMDQEGFDLFDEDLGTGKPSSASGTPINCQYGPSGVQVGLTCLLFFGDKATNTHAKITISGGTFSAGVLYQIAIDEVRNPNLLTDDRHIYLILEGYSGGSLVTSEINYDYSLKYISTTQVLGLNPDPTLVGAGSKYSTSVVMGGSGAGPNENNISYQFSFTQQVVAAKSSTQYYDFFIIEFPMSAFNKQPYAVDCNVGYCRLMRGWNWVVWKYNANQAVGSTVSMTVRGLENAKISSTTVHLLGYTVHNRVVVDKKYFLPLTAVTPISPATGEFTIVAVDYPDTTKIPQAKIIKYLFTVKLPISLEANKGLIDIIFPSTSYVPQSFCADTLNYPITAYSDYISCVYTSTNNAFTVSGFGAIASGTTIQVEGWAKNPSATTTNPSFTVQIYQDAARTQKLLSFSAIGPNISAYTSFTISKHLSNYDTYIRSGTYGEFRFYINPGAISETDYIEITFPNNDVTAQGQTYLSCGFNSIEASVCRVTSTSPLTIDIYGPVDSPLLAATQYQVYVTVESGPQPGMLFSGSAGETYFTIAINAGSQTNVYFIIYPAAKFGNLATLETTFENAGEAIDVIVSIQTSVAVPNNGKLVVAFPRFASDGTTNLFLSYLGKSGVVSGSPVDCAGKPTGITTYSCTIEQTPRKIMVSLRLSTGLNSAFSLLINDVKLPATPIPPASPNTIGHIPIEVYTVDDNDNILEAIVFQDHITPISPASPINTSPIVTQTPIGVYHFSINVGSSTNSFSGTNDRVVIKFPVGYDLSAATFTLGTTYTSTEVINIGNIMIVRLVDTITSSPQSFIISGVVNPTVLTTPPTVYSFVVVGHLYNTVQSSLVSSTTPAFSPVPTLTLPLHKNKEAPLTISITFAPTGSALIGSKTVYLLGFVGVSSLAAPRIDMSLPCTLGTDPLYCILKPTGVYYSVSMTTVTLLVFNVGDAPVSPASVLTIYNVKEFMSSTSVSIQLIAYDTTAKYVRYQSTTASVAISASTAITSTTVAPTLVTDQIQGTESTFTIPIAILAGHVSTAIVSFFYDLMPINTLGLTSTSATIEDNGSSIGSCTIDSLSLQTQCTLSGTPTTALTMTLSGYPTPSAQISSTATNIYQIVGTSSALVLFDYSIYTLVSYPTTSPTFSASDSTVQTDNYLTLSFTTSYLVPAGGTVEITLATSPSSTLIYIISSSSLANFVGKPVITQTGSKIYIKNFSLMAIGSYSINLGWSLASDLPNITDLKTTGNGLTIESSTITQNSGSYTAPTSGITITSVSIIEASTILLKFSCASTYTDASTFVIQFASTIAAIDAHLVSFNLFSGSPTFVVSTNKVTLSTTGSFIGGTLIMKLYFTSTMPTSITSISLISSMFEVIATTSAATAISPVTFLTSQNVQSLNSLSFIRKNTLSGNLETLSFRIIMKTSVASTEQLMIQFPTEIDIETMYTSRHRLKCNYRTPYTSPIGKYRAKKCHFQKLTKTYLVIQDTFAVNTVYDFSVLRLGLSSSNRFFWPLPSSPKLYYFILDKTAIKAVQDLTVPTITATDTMQMEIYNTQTTGNLFMNEDGSVGKASLYNVKFSASGSYNYLDIELPTSQNQGSSSVALFDYKLQSTLTNGMSFPCTDVPATLGASVKYRLFYGIPALDLPARIRILYSASSTVNINIQGLFNPATVSQMTPVTIKTGTSAGVLGSTQVFNYAVYTVAYSPAAATISAPAFSPTTASTVVTITMSNIPLLNALSVHTQSTLRFDFDSRQYKSTMSVPSSNAAKFSTSSVYFSTTATSIATPYTMVVSNIKTPPIIGLFTFSNYQVVEIKARKVRKIFSVSVTQTLTAGGNFILNQLVSASTYKKSSTNAYYTFTYDLQEDQISGNTIQIIFPSDYNTVAGLSCKMMDKNTLSTISATCASTASSPNGFTIILSQALAQGTSYKIQVRANNPSAVATTGVFTLKFWKTSALTELQSQPTIPGVAIVNEVELTSRLWQPKTVARICQSTDTCPIRFSASFNNVLTKELDKIVINTTKYINTMVSLQSIVLELVCWIGDYASYYCYQDTATNTITVFAPVNTNVPASTTFHVYIESWRDPRHQPFAASSTATRDFILLPTWTDYTSDPAMFQNVQISEVHTLTGTQTIQKMWQFVNRAFNWLNFGFLCSYSTTINHHTILKVRFQMPNSVTLNSALATEPNWGRFVIYLETVNEVGQSLFPYTLDTRFIKDGQQIDCLCNNEVLTSLFLCYVQYGGTDPSSPVSISIQPQQISIPNSYYVITFPKLQLPTTVNYYTRIGMKALQYDSVTKVVNQILEILSDFVFYTMSDHVYTETSAALNFPSGDTVGQPLQITWDYNITPAQYMNTRDRVIMTTTTLENIIEHPTNPSSSTLKTTSNFGNVYIYPLIKWVEIEFTANLAAGAKSVITYDFKNMPYQITAGVDFELYSYANGEQENIKPFNNIPYADPHPLYFKKFEYVVMYISQPNTITFTFQPYNKIPLGGYLSIYWGSLSVAADADWIFQNGYCQVKSGLQNSQCVVVSTELRIMIYDFSIGYDPVPDGVIKFEVKVQNSNNPGLRSNFAVTTYWDETGYDNRHQVSGSTANLSHMIDQDLAYANFNVVSIPLLALTLLERYQEPIPVCGGSRGPIVLKFQFRKNYAYPFDYLSIDFYGTIQPLGANEELICYFADTTNGALVFVKTFRCDLLPTGIINAYVPEETDLYNTKEYLLYITIRTLNFNNWGIQINGPSNIRWTRITTTKESSAADFYNEVAWIEAKIPACSFDPNNFRVYSFSHELNTAAYSNSIDATANAEKYLYTYINMTLATVNNVIASGLVTSLTRTRLVFEFQTHNEAFPSWDEDVTGTKSTVQKDASCGGLYNGPGFTMVPAGQTFLTCSMIPASGQMPDTPSVIVMTGHPAIASGNIFNVSLGRIKLPNQITDGTIFTQIGSKQYDDSKRYQIAAHMRISVEQMQDDGTFYAINKQWRYNIIPQFLDATTPTQFDSSIWRITYYYYSVTSQMRNVTINIYPLGVILNRLRSAVVLQYSYPYVMVNWAECYQHNYFSYPCQDSIFCDIPHGRVACTFLPQSRWLVFSNNIFTTLTVGPSLEPPVNRFLGREREFTGNRLNPPFMYLYGNAKSLFRAWIYDNHRTIIQRVNQNITPVQNNCGLVMETTAHDNPQNHEVLYRIGLYISTRANEMQTIRLLAPKQFQDFQHCRVRRGVVLKDFKDISNAIKCTVVFQSTNWLIEITNFSYKKDYSDGLIILEFLITNPYDSGWTNHWVCRTFADMELMIHDYQTNAYGRTWVGKYIPYPNLFRVYRNTVSYQNRLAGINEYSELHMRIIPSKSHPVTDDLTSTLIEIWMPLTYDIPNGGINVCQVDHIYHTDITGQYCQITSDRKVFVNTNKFVGLQDRCGLVSFTTTNAIGGNNGVKMPSVAGDDTFQVFITGKDKDGNVSQEYSDLSATTAPALLTTTAYPNGNSFSISTQVHMSNVEARIVVKFYTPRTIPSGYDTSVGISDPSLKNPIGYIDISFSTLEYITWYTVYSWKLSLTNAVQTNPFTCKAFSGLIPKTGETLSCTIFPSTLASIYFPVIVRVTNFQAITTNTFIELHLLNIPAPNYSYWANQNTVSVNAYKTNGDGSVNSIIDTSTVALGKVTLLTKWDQWETTLATVTPNTVGAYSEWLFYFDQLYDVSTAQNVGCFLGVTPNISFAVGTIFAMKIPSNFFELVDDGKMQATLGDYPLTTWMYEATNQIFFQVITAIDCGNLIDFSLNPLKITQLRNAAYAFLSTYSIRIDTYFAKEVIGSYFFRPLPAPSVASFVSLSLSLSKYFADERYVTYTYSFTPSYKIPQNSVVSITLPARTGVLEFPSFGAATPQEVCVVSSTLLNLASCQGSLSAAGFTIHVDADIAEQTSLTVQIIGTRNHPTYSSITLATDFSISIIQSGGYQINAGYFPQITYLQQRDASFLYLTMAGTSYFQNIIADYTFTIQSTSYLPLGGFIYIDFPNSYLEKLYANSIPLPVPSSLTGSWTSNSLIFSSSYGPQGAVYTRMKITPQFAWPAKSSLKLTFNSFPNPVTTTTTALFSIFTLYDGKAVDSTDPTDTSLTFTYQAQPPAMATSFSFSPQNEGTLSTYSIGMTPTSDVPVGSSITFKFDTSLYPSNLSTSSQNVSVTVNGVSVTCTVVNGVVTIPVTTVLPAGAVVTVTLSNVMNPTQGTTSVVGQITNGSTILAYDANIGPIVTKATPNDLKMTLLSTTSNALQSKATYNMCVQTSDKIAINDLIYIYFPSQFPFKSTYPCSITSSHSNTELPYAKTTSSPSCLTQNDQNRIVISGQTAAKTSTNSANLCYKIDGIENPSIPGTTDNFKIQIFDQTNEVIKSETSGLTSTITTLDFAREGFQVIVGTIPDLPKGATSNEISIELEIAVSYEVSAIPYLPNFEFIPPIVVFDPTKGKVQYFKIKPLTNAVVGSKQIVWTKQESTTTKKFSEIPDSYFNLIAKPYQNSLKAVLQTTVSRTALQAESLPIEVKLNQPASEVLTIFFYTKNHAQDSLLTFSPSQLVFKPGEVSQKFKYTTKEGAISGQIVLELDSVYSSIYVMPYNTVSFEILDSDDINPTVINYYIESMDRTYMYLRISCDESVTIYSMLTMQGTLPPTTSELKNTGTRANNGRITDVLEYYMNNSSYVAPVSKNFIYYDTYLYFQGLQEQTDYLLYFYAEDLTGNRSPVQNFNFTTLKKHMPASFTLRLNKTVSDDTLFSAFGLITTLPSNRFQIVSKPSKYTIPEVIEDEVLDIVETVAMDYSFILLQNITSNENRPLQTISLLQDQFTLLQSEISSGLDYNILDDTFNINEHAYEIYVLPQELKYTPTLKVVSEDTVSFAVQLKYKGNGYGIVQLYNSTAPTSYQIKHGLNSSNYLLPTSQYANATFVFNSYSTEEAQNITNIFSFSGLLDNTEYVAYFIGENNQLVNPDLMDTADIVSYKFTTMREKITIPEWFRADVIFSTLLRFTSSLIFLIISLILITN